MKKRIFSILTALALCLTMLPAAARAAGVWDGTADTSWYTGAEDGAAEFTISTAAELAGLVGLVNGGNSFSGKTITLDADIVLNEDGAASPNNWTPIGNSSNSFKGTFDGLGHTVKGLYVNITRTGNYSTYGGLFANVDNGGTVKNLNVNGTVTVTNKDSHFVYVGGVVGYAGYASGALSTVENCSFTGEVTGTSDYSSYVGGVVGTADNTTVRGCFNSGTVTVNGQRYSYAGGVVGRAYYNTTVENCYNTGAVTGTGSGTFHVGGAAGYIYYRTTVKNCYNTGTVTTTATGNYTTYVGGVVGCAEHTANNPSTVENCYFLQDEGINSGLSGIGYAASSSSASNTGATGKDSAAFASGEVAYLLQGSQAGTVWVQKLLDQGNSVPVLAASLSSEEAAQYTVYRVTFTAGGNTEYRYAVEGGTVAVPDVPAGYSNWYTDGDQVFIGSTTVTKNLTVTAKTQESTPGIAIDYENEILTGFAVGAAYTIDGTEVTLTEGDTTLSVKDYMGQTVSIVRKGGDGSVDSAAQPLAIPARPGKPTGLQGKNETVDGQADGKITGVTAAMEYKLSAAGTWTACGGTEVTGLAPGEYQVRIAATDGSFAGTAADVAIDTGAARTYTLNVTAPTFDSPVYYGYDQPAARAITIFNTGNSASAISGVALSGENAAAFALNKTDGAAIQPGATDDTTYTIRPAAGLGAGAYTAAITVTYQDSMTAGATVSFTVTPAAQDAPADAPAVKSRTYNSVALEAVADNVNGVKAEYGISADGGQTWTWQDSPAFTGLAAGTAYTFAARYGAAENYAASAASQTVEATTPAQPSGGSGSKPTYTPTVEQADNGSAAVSPKNPSRGDKVTVTPRPEAGYAVASVTVTGRNGKTVPVTDNGDGTYSFTQPASKVTVEVTFTEVQKPVEKLPFTDVPASAYYYDAVAWAVGNGITAGTTSATFSPDAPCTRAQAVTFLWRAAGSPAPRSGANPFTDVRPGAYYYDAVLWAVENGITMSTTAATFSPDQTCTRAQIVTFLYRAKGAVATGNNSFADVADSAYYYGPVLWAAGNGITVGTTTATFSPDNACTRAQIVTFLHRAEA